MIERTTSVHLSAPAHWFLPHTLFHEVGDNRGQSGCCEAFRSRRDPTTVLHDRLLTNVICDFRHLSHTYRPLFFPYLSAGICDDIRSGKYGYISS